MSDYLLDNARWFSFAGDVIVKSTVLLMVAMLVGLTVGRRSAAVRHRIWGLTFVALLLLPAVSLIVPGVPLRVIPDRWEQGWRSSRAALSTFEGAAEPVIATKADLSPQHQVVQPAQRESAAMGDVDTAAEVEPTETVQQRAFQPATGFDTSPLGTEMPSIERGTAPRAAASRPRLPWLPAVWLGGALVVLAPLMCGLLGNWRLRSRSVALDSAEWQDLAAELCDVLNLRRAVTMLSAGTGQMPMTFGARCPYIVLPAEAHEWCDERRRVVLLHELAHIKRRDVPWQIVARLACALYWFHPGTWLIVRRMRIDREHACDDCVLAAGQIASNYASHLLEIARGHRSCSPLATAALSMARRSQLEGRLLAVLDGKRTRAPLGRARASVLAGAALLAVAVVAVLRPMLRGEVLAATPDKPASSTTPSAGEGQNVQVVTGRVMSEQGEPVPGAKVQVVAMDRNDGWPVYRTKNQEVVYLPTKSDADGRFQVSFPKRPTGSHPALWLLASADGPASSQLWLKPRQQQQDVDVTLWKAREMRVQLIDTIGNPVVGVQPQIWQTVAKTKHPQGYHTSFWFPNLDVRPMVEELPIWSRSDEQGYTTALLSSDTQSVSLLIDDEHWGGQLLDNLDVTGDSIAAVLQPPLFVSGKVVAADTGEPIGGAKVLLTERPYRFLETAADGTFHIRTVARHNDELRPDSELNVYAYPPPDSPYLFLALERKRPREGKNVEMTMKLRRGISVTGQVIDRATHKPIAGAEVFFRQQEYNNKYHNAGSWPNYSEAQMRYASDSEGRFRMPVWPGPGYILAFGPTSDYLHVMMSDGDLYYGKTGLQRYYPDGAQQVSYVPGEEHPTPVPIELERGVTLRRKVVRPDGQPANGWLHARSYVTDRRAIDGNTPAIQIENGLIELPGFDPERSSPLFFLDIEHHCAATVSPTAEEAQSDAPIELLPCGSAKMHFIDDKGDPIIGHEPWLQVVVTPGAIATHHIEANQPLWADTIIWQNMFWEQGVARRELPKTDADGNIVVNDLIPGATYNVSFVNKQGRWDEGFEFTIRPGETTDVGDVQIPNRE